MRETTATVVTVTRRRVHLLGRAIDSVKRQDWNGGILRHLILVDDCRETAEWLSEHVNDDGHVDWKLIERQSGESSGPARLARLRNLACELAESEWIAFLDDDNEFEPQHIRTLVACAAAYSSAAVHSYRKLFHFDGTPFLEEFWPWCRRPSEARERYWEYVGKGILLPGSNVVRERAGSAGAGQSLTHIDMNVWLLRRELLLKCAMPEHFTEKDWLANLTEDDKLLEALTEAGVQVAATGIASVRYYLGGYSNDFERKHKHSEVWECPGASSELCSTASTAATVEEPS